MTEQPDRVGGGQSDRWLDWLLQGRDASNAEVRNRSLACLQPIYERVLDRAQLGDGETLLEVGAGEGTLGLLGLQRVGRSGRLILTDVSGPVIAHLRDTLPPSFDHNVSRLVSPVETLAGVEDKSVDAVLCRSVLIYSTDLSAALAACARVLRPGGRVSLFEPLWHFHEPSEAGDFFGRELEGVADEVQAVLTSYAAQAADSPVTAAALVSAAEAAGFQAIRVVVEADSVPQRVGDDAAVHQVLRGRPNPNSTSVEELARQVLPRQRADRFLAALEHAVRAGRGRVRSAAVYLTAVI